AKAIAASGNTRLHRACRMTDPSVATTEHLTCPWCGYDLFGLPTKGDIVRCPECGNRADLRLLRISPKDRARRVRGMESLPAACAGFAFFAVIFALMAKSILRESPSEPAGMTFAGLALGCAAGWGFCARTYHRRYRFVLGAVQVFAMFHVCLWLFVVGIGLVCGGLCSAMLDDRVAPGLLGVCLVGAASLWFGGWLYRRARGKLAHMYEQLAGAPDTRRNGNSSNVGADRGLPTETSGNETSPQNGRPSRGTSSGERPRPPEP
ncbi:MAG: hypothetical protein ACPMAQ_11265, partial [Phycisphaerae bacterium]